MQAKFDFDQAAELERVTSRIGLLIIDFLRRLEPGQQFRAADLQRYVCGQCDAAPASADRVLRELRKKGLVDYKVVNRRQSLYERV